jgi:hypothetical protein
MEREDWHAEVISLAEEVQRNGVDPAALLREGLALAEILRRRAYVRGVGPRVSYC